MNIETKIRNLIKFMDECDQPYEDMFDEIIKLVNKHHDDWYNESRIAHYENERLRMELEKYMKRVKVLMDGYDKILDGVGLPVTIATECVAEAMLVRVRQ